jgi:pentatricopeptide repeat protein
MARNEITPTLVSYSSHLHDLCRAVKAELAFSLCRRLKEQSLKCDHVVYSIFFYGCCQYLDLKAVYDLWNDMVHNNFPHMLAIILV